MGQLLNDPRGLGLELSDKPLVLCIGDSYTYGDGVAHDRAWPHLLAQQLPEHQVINAGVRGANLLMMLDALKHYQERKPAEHVLLTILDIDMLRLGGKLADESCFIDDASYATEVDASAALLAQLLDQCARYRSRVSVNLWARDTFVARFHRLSRQLGALSSLRKAPYRDDIAHYLSVLSYGRFKLSDDDGHPGELAHRLIARRMFSILAEDAGAARAA